MSFLKQLLNPFVEFDAEKQKQNVSPTPIVVQPAPTLTPAPVQLTTPSDENAVHPLVSDTKVQDLNAQIPTYAPSGTMSEPLPEHVQYFVKLIDDANVRNPVFHGTDYKEFIDSKLDIDDITDEQLKYKTAYNILKSTGLTKEKLLSTGQEYLNVIGRDLNAFQSAHSQKYQKEVRQKELLIQKKAEELQALAQRINALKTEINQLTQDVDLTKNGLNAVKNSFLLAGEIKQKEIDTELQKITQYF